MFVSKIVRAVDHPYILGKGGRLVSFLFSLKNQLFVFGAPF